jgi:hypothetical protein
MTWNITVIVICILIAAFAVWKEFARVNKSRLVWRVLTVIAAAVTLACIALPITYQVEVSKQNKKEAILLTEGFNEDSLIRYSTTQLYTADVAIKKAVPKAIKLYEAADIKSDSTITALRVLGDGLDDEELQQLAHLPLIFNPEVLQQGVTAVAWNGNLKAGDELKVQGTYTNGSSKKIKLVLQGLSTGLDSATVEAKATSSFSLSITPKNTSRNIYDLIALSGTDTLQKETIPVQIEPTKPLNVLILTASPDFESRFLKNWLSAKGYGIAVRSAISKDKFTSEFINLQQFPIAHLSPAIFSKFDLVVGDLSVLKTLNAGEAAAMHQEVTQKGMGLIIRADSTLRSNSWLQKDFPADRLAGKDPATIALILQGSSAHTAKLNAGLVYLASQSNTQTLVNDEHGHVLASAALAGKGKMIFTSLNSTFNWVLNGNKNEYSNLWSLLISKAARPVQVTESWNILSAIPTILKPVKLQLASAATPSAIKAGGAVIAPQQNSLIPFEWASTYWPGASGWQSVWQSNDVLSWFYVYNAGDWKSIRALKKQADTKAYASQNAINTNVTKQIHEKVTIAVSKIYFYVLLLFALVFLWLEARLR